VAEKQQDSKKETPNSTQEKDEEDMDEFAKSFKGLKGAFI
jgi:hypothetical protein